MPKDTVACGRFLKPFGVRGELKFDPYLPDNIDPAKLTHGYLVTSGTEDAVKIEIASVRRAGHLWIVRPEGIESPQTASRFTHSELWVDRSVLQPLGEGEYLHQDIIGCVVYDEQGVLLGTVTGVLPTGANDVWEIRDSDDREVLIPVIAQVVREIDTPNKKVVVRMPDGLYD